MLTPFYHSFLQILPVELCGEHYTAVISRISCNFTNIYIGEEEKTAVKYSPRGDGLQQWIQYRGVGVVISKK